MWITTEDLGKYLTSKYPEMKFYEKKYKYEIDTDPTVFVSGISKKVFCEFNVDTFSEKDFEEWAKDVWSNRTLVHLEFTNNKDGYSGCGRAVDNRTEMENGIASMVKRVKDALGIKEPEMRQLTIFDMLGGE